MRLPISPPGRQPIARNNTAELPGNSAIGNCGRDLTGQLGVTVSGYLPVRVVFHDPGGPLIQMTGFSGVPDQTCASRKHTYATQWCRPGKGTGRFIHRTAKAWNAHLAAVSCAAEADKDILLKVISAAAWRLMRNHRLCFVQQGERCSERLTSAPYLPVSDFAFPSVTQALEPCVRWHMNGDAA